MKPRYTYHVTCIFLLALLAACAQVGLPTPETLNQKIAIGYGTVSQVRTTALQLLQAGKIKADDAQNIQNSADQGRQALDIARTLSATDASAATNKLQMATTILTAAQAYLATRQ